MGRRSDFHKHLALPKQEAERTGGQCVISMLWDAVEQANGMKIQLQSRYGHADVAHNHIY
jgi:hypothetical protein